MTDPNTPYGSPYASGGQGQPGQTHGQSPQGQYPMGAAQPASYGAPAGHAQPGYGQAAQNPGGTQPVQPVNYEVPVQHPQHMSPKKSGGGAKTFFIAFAGAAVACIIGLGAAFGLGAFNQPGQSESAAAQEAIIENYGEISVNGEDVTLPEAVAAKCLPSVAAIDVYATTSTGYESFFGFGFGEDAALEASSLGSGVVLSEDGYILTNNHVIEGGEAFEVTIEGETYPAELVGSDPSSDVAVLKAVDATGLTPMEIGDSDNLTIGEWVMTIGSPFGLEQSVATGIVSATSRSQIMDASESGLSSGQNTIYPNMIQTDAAINPGNSGGAMVDSEGKLIGINTLITSYSGNYSGVGFAIPVNYAYNLAQQIIAGESPTHAQLGVSLNNVNATFAQRYGLATDTGAYVAYVNPGSGAEAAGIEAGDIITGFDGSKVESASDLMLDVRGKQPGDTVTITLIDNSGQTKDVDVTLGSDQNQQQPQTQQQSWRFFPNAQS